MGTKSIYAENIEYGDINFCEGRFSAKTFSSDDGIEDAFKLRHKIFAEQLRWVQETASRLERDRYDDYSVHFGVYEDDALLAYLRVVKPGCPYMIDKEFVSLVGPDHEVRRAMDACEISRLCVSPEARRLMTTDNSWCDSIQMILHKSLYHWCNMHGIRYLYFVVERKVYRMMRFSGIVCKPIGDPLVMPDGVEAIAVILDLREFDAYNERKNPRMYQWFSQYQPIPSVLPSQRPGLGLRH
jgi:acyl homoserine lactone synthase